MLASSPDLVDNAERYERSRQYLRPCRIPCMPVIVHNCCAKRLVQYKHGAIFQAIPGKVCALNKAWLFLLLQKAHWLAPPEHASWKRILWSVIESWQHAGRLVQGVQRYSRHSIALRFLFNIYVKRYNVPCKRMTWWEFVKWMTATYFEIECRDSRHICKESLAVVLTSATAAWWLTGSNTFSESARLRNRLKF